jgi:hypothetical protein
MQRFLIVGLMALATLGLAGLSIADVPNESNSTVACECIADAGTGIGSGKDEAHECNICPGGDKFTEDIWVHVIVRNHQNQPLTGSTVTVTAVALNGETLSWDDGVSPVEADEDPQVMLSAGDGSADFMYDEGGVDQLEPNTTFPNVDFNVLMSGPGPGSASKTCDTQFEVTGFDHDISGIVDLPDLAVFGVQGWAAQDLECDYNHSDGAVPVDLIDFAMFAQSWGHALDNQ